jgi:pyrroline-5-carboxylate reductase
MINKKLGFIGTGNMATALIKSILDSKLTTQNNIICSDINHSNLTQAKQSLKIKTESNTELCKSANIIFLCVKPQNFPELFNEINKSTKNKIIVSIAAGITLKTLKDNLEATKFVRLMPNTPCLVQEMAAAYSVFNLTKEEKNLIHILLNSAGIAFELDELHLDTVTAISGSSPAFFAHVINEFTNAAVKEGMPHDIALKLAIQSCKGTATLLQKMEMEPKDLIKMVASPNGTTEAGLKVLKSDKTLQHTFEATIKRAKELGK